MTLSKRLWARLLVSTCTHQQNKGSSLRNGAESGQKLDFESRLLHTPTEGGLGLEMDIELLQLGSEEVGGNIYLSMVNRSVACDLVRIHSGAE